MRKVGLCCAWGCENVIVPVLTNQLKIYDEIYVTVSAHHQRFEHLGDNTKRAIITKFGLDDRVKLVEHNGYRNNCDATKCEILNELRTASNVHPGDIIGIVDADEFVIADSEDSQNNKKVTVANMQ